MKTSDSKEQTEGANGGSVQRLVRRNDIDDLRKVYGRYRGEHMGANAVLSLCDEVAQLRAALTEILNLGQVPPTKISASPQRKSPSARS